MYYLDTCIIISFFAKKESDHVKSANIINKLNGDFFISTFTALELFCNIYRNVDKFLLISGLEKASRSRLIKTKVILEYMIKSLDLIIEPDKVEEVYLKEFNSNVFKKFFETFEIIPYVNLHTGDSLVLSYAHDLKKRGKIKYLVTIDRDFENCKESIKNCTGIEVIFN